MNSTSNRKHIDFIGKRYAAGIGSTIACAIAAILVLYPGPKYGIDFAGGTNVIVKFAGDVTGAEVQAAATSIGLADTTVTEFGPAEAREFIIQTSSISSIAPEKQTALESNIRARFGAEAQIEFDESSGDRVYIRLPESAYAADGTAPTTETFVSKNSEMIRSLEESLTTGGFSGTSVLTYGNPAERRFLVNLQAIFGHVDDGFSSTFGEKFAGVERVESVGPRVGQQLRADAIKAIMIALLLILLYIAFRFDIRYAPGAVICLFHDVLITLGIFVIMGWEINLSILAAFLTIVGYSLNDTIVNFDRIRENIAASESKKPDLYELVNRSVNEVLSRTIITSGTTILAVLAIIVLGGDLIRTFGWAMFIGIMIGTYSSIFVANPLMIWMNGVVEAQAAKAPVSTVESPVIEEDQ